MSWSYNCTTNFSYWAPTSMKRDDYNEESPTSTTSHLESEPRTGDWGGGEFLKFTNIKWADMVI